MCDNNLEQCTENGVVGLNEEVADAKPKTLRSTSDTYSTLRQPSGSGSAQSGETMTAASRRSSRTADSANTGTDSACGADAKQTRECTG